MQAQQTAGRMFAVRHSRNAQSHVRFPLLIALMCAMQTSFAHADLVDSVEHKSWKLAADQIAADDVNSRQPDGMTALHWAVQHGNLAWTKRLTKAGADVNATTQYGITPLAIACESGNPALAEQLLGAGADPNARLPGKVTPLMIAAKVGKADIVKTLLDSNADIDATQRNEQTALMWAAAAGHDHIVRQLLDAGADANAKVSAGFTAVLFAARNGHADVVESFVNRGADVNAAMKPKRTSGRNPRKGMTALMLAVESGHFELAMRLIGWGANPNDEQSEFSPLHALTWVRRAQLGDNPAGDPEPRGSGSLTSLEFVRAIVAAGADVNLQLRRGKGGPARLNPRGATPLLMACHTLDVPYVNLLLELGADPNLTNHDGTTTLLAAAGIGVVNPTDGYPGTEDEVEVLLKRFVNLGLDINTVDKNGETTMHGAAYRNSPRTIKLVALLGADPVVWDHKNKHGWSPLLIGKGYRPGSFKPDPATIAAVTEVLGDRIHKTAQDGKSLKWQDP